ncbi:aminoglycoside phosphotransferase [Vandammella animalimorsus]|uniref:Aminoglycoside phosphotransferase n=1 Tax=Vandammella animalimorsus TaxID=2029117 RepID=A0A2A2T7F9_9BURK|nr:phosphotransferase [Vandammella animalimorsus]PAT32807.1 aminoglycoside phosphotransferase [Vandammella animalimorsus]PAX17836.1 aminoglycoside phosphotransferase [Vandammella animalimorsus]PAX19990.1 aminoglycoside phosphotransferase [Vandammella animalimorsus]
MTDTSTPIAWPDPARQALFQQWLERTAAEHQLLPASLRHASADASFRRYLRVQDAAGRSRVIMDAPPDKEPLAPFLASAALLREAGLAVPELLAVDEAAGFLLMNDLGQHTALQHLAPDYAPERAQPLMLQALDWLVQMQTRARPDALPAYDAAVLQRELQLFPDWYIAAHRQVQLSDAQRQQLQGVFDTLVAHNLQAPSVFVHRDYMLRNLMVAPAEAGAPARLSGLLDFQDALRGPLTYDLASLLRDAFHSWEEDFVIDLAVRYWERARQAGLLAARPDWASDFGEFYRAVEWMGLQRHLKVAGIFARLTLRDGKPQYLADTPRFIHHIRSTASRYRELRPLLRLVDAIEQTPQTEAFSFGRM